jgi:predicted TIM-barrel fold metal-dependent hydrolase
MGFIDSDTHVRETDKTWEYLDPAERGYRPRRLGGNWQVSDITTAGPFDPAATPQGYFDLFPGGSADFSQPADRLRRMDDLGVDVQVVFSTWWLNADVFDPLEEAALARSWNRWMAESTADTGGRCLWACQAPVRMTERALAEMEFAKRHGAAAVHMRGLRHGIGVADPVNFPLYERAQELDMTIAIHLGGDIRVLTRQPHLILLTAVAPVVGAFHSILKADLHAKFPRLRWAFLEAGASWLPFALQEAFRSDGYASYRNFTDWRASAGDALAGQNLYVACQIDDDLRYLLNLVGESNLVHGTDFGHLDVGSDPYGLQMIADSSEADPGALARIVDGNARALWGIDTSFTPAPELVDRTVPRLETVQNWAGATVVE